MPGTSPRNLYEGSRSEIFADYLFSAWGPVTPVRRQSDTGYDLYCALWEGTGSTRSILHYYTVQIKSTDEPWEFNSEAQVRWLIEHPTPLFLGTVDKVTCTLRIYHLTPRFAVWTSTEVPDQLSLRPGAGPSGEWLDWNWKKMKEFSLSAPILEVTLRDFMDPQLIEKFRQVLEAWLVIDRDNCDLVRRKMFRYKMPMSYTTNELPPITRLETGTLPGSFAAIAPGVRALVETLECFGHQLGHQGDMLSAFYAAALASHIVHRYRKELQVGPENTSTNFYRFIEERFRSAAGTSTIPSVAGTLASVKDQIERTSILKALTGETEDTK